MLPTIPAGQRTSIVPHGKGAILDPEAREGSASAIAPCGEFPSAFRDGVADRNDLLRVEGAVPHLGGGHLDHDPLGEKPAELAHYSPGWYERSWWLCTCACENHAVLKRPAA